MSPLIEIFRSVVAGAVPQLVFAAVKRLEATDSFSHCDAVTGHNKDVIEHWAIGIIL